MSNPSTSYGRGSRGHRGNGGRDRDDGRDNRERKRGNEKGSYDRPPRGKFQKRGSRGRGRGGARKTSEEFPNVLTTLPRDVSKTACIGESGAENDQQVTLITNYYKVEQRKPVSMTMYHIDFDPHTDSKAYRWELIRSLENYLGTHVYDGMSSVYLMNKLPDRENYFDRNLKDGTPFRIRLRERREIPYTDGMFFTILNLVLRRCFEGMDLNLVGRNYYDALAAINVPSLRLQLWPGFLSSIRQHEDDILLCVNSVHKVIREETAYDIMRNCKLDLLKSKSALDYQKNVMKELLGVTVLTTYNRKAYRIDDIDWAARVGSETFETKSGITSYIDYYRNQYQCNIKDPNQPLLVSKAKAKGIRGGSKEFTRLIPELCIVTGLDQTMRNNFQQMRLIAQHTRLTPEDRINRLMALNGRLQEEVPRQIFNDNRIELGRELVQVQGRRIAQENISFGNDKSFQLQFDANAGEAGDWTKSLRNNVMFKSKNLGRWAFICPNSCRAEGEDFIRILTEVSEDMGMVVNQNFKREYLTTTNKVDPYVNAIEKFLQKDPSFLVIIVDKPHFYAAIKHFCYCNQAYKAVPSQVILMKTLARKQNLVSVVTKIAIQINCKLGGIPWLINIPINGLLVIGFDVTHDTQTKKRSYGAMVANLNPKEKGGTFYSQVNSHEHGDQVSQYFGLNVVGAVLKFKEVHDSLPKKIIIYRDGVGDGQIEYVNNIEVKDIEEKLNNIYNKNESGDGEQEEYKLMFVIINKKINTRFFIQSHNNRAENPLPGTVVDSVITLPERYDFYMVSQNVNQGTVSPTSYNIIKNNIGLNSAQIQKLTFKFCHSYYNWSGTTRVPAVVQYAKKLALLVGQHLHSEPTQIKDDNMLYFL